jgi:hypothetical protein
MQHIHLGLVPAVLLTWVGAAAAVDNVGSIEDEATCRAGGVGVSGPELIDFFRKRTPDPSLQRRLTRLVQDLDAATFPARQQAARQLVELGPSALSFLRQALRGNSLEMTRRAERCIEEIERRHNLALPAAAARLLRTRLPEGACTALLAYIPFADDPLTEEEVLAALAQLGSRAARPDAALLFALKDPVPARRGAAALAIGRAGNAEQQKEVVKLLADPDPKVCLRAAQGLIAARDKRAVATLLTLVSGAPLDLAVQAEDILARVAGDQAPAASLTDATRAVRRKCQEAWEGWWKANEDRIDLARADIEIFSESAAYRARTVVRRFHEALVKADRNALKQLTDAPFYWFNLSDQPDRASLDRYWENEPTPGGFQKIDTLTVAIKGVSSVDQFLKVSTKEARDFLASMRKETIRVVYAEVSSPLPMDLPQTLRIGVLVRVTGQPRVIGASLIGPVNP